MSADYSEDQASDSALSTDGGAAGAPTGDGDRRRRAYSMAGDAAVQRLASSDPPAAGAPTGGASASLLSTVTTDVKDGAQILWELSRLTDFHVFSGTFDGDLDIGKAIYYIQLVHSGGPLSMFELDPASRGSNMVHLNLNLYHRTFSVTAPSLRLLGFNSATFQSRAARLDGVSINGTTSSAVLTVTGAAMNDALFIGPNGRVAATEVDLTALRGNGVYLNSGSGKSVLGGLQFDSAHILGLQYPGMPATDLSVKQAGLTFDLLWTTIGPSSGGGLPAAPG
jgi:hypothetical protein